jgi:hypothetical protein
MPLTLWLGNRTGRQQLQRRADLLLLAIFVSVNRFVVVQSMTALQHVAQPTSVLGRQLSHK